MAIRGITNSDYLTGTILSGANPLTVACWFKVDALPGTGGFQGVWSCDDNATNFTQPYIDNPAGTARIMHGFSHGFGDQLILSAPTANTWYGIISVINPGTPSVVYLSTAGAVPIKVTDTTPTPNAGNFPSTSIVITNESAHDETLNGDIALFMVWDRLLSEQEARRQLTQWQPISKNKLRYFLPLLKKGAPERPRDGFGLLLTQTGALGWSSQTPPVIVNKSLNSRRATLFNSQTSSSTPASFATRKLLLGVGV